MVTTRPITSNDLPDVLACQAVYDEELERTTLPGYGWDETKIRKAVRSFKSKQLQTRETRVLVAEVKIEQGKWVCGIVVYEYDDTEYEIKLLAAHPSAPAAVRQKLLETVLEKAATFRRDQVRFDVSDYDHENLKLLVRVGAAVVLKPYAFDGFADAWRCNLDSRVGAKGIERTPSCKMHERE